MKTPKIKLVVTDVYSRKRGVEIDLECPQCKTKLECKTKLVGHNVLAEISYQPTKQLMDILPDGAVDEYGSCKHLEGDLVLEYRCAHCDEVLVAGKEHTLPQTVQGDGTDGGGNEEQAIRQPSMG
jgi:phage FluMu protein Com